MLSFRWLVVLVISLMMLACSQDNNDTSEPAKTIAPDSVTIFIGSNEYWINVDGVIRPATSIGQIENLLIEIGLPNTTDSVVVEVGYANEDSLAFMMGMLKRIQVNVSSVEIAPEHFRFVYPE